MADDKKKQYVFKIDELPWKSTHGGSVKSKLVLDEEHGGATRFSLLVNSMRAGLNCKHDTPGHTHEEEHFIYVIEGTGGVSIGGVIYEVEPGDVCIVPPGAVHYVFADPIEDMTYLVLYSPAGPEKEL
ncbi:MAG: cupin domain-containing protein [Sphaerochaetaceae bacterium]|jgi:quercetin dioxygenase-like cupin family protein